FELVQQIASGNPTPIRLLAPDVPPDLEAVTMRAMHVRRDMRHRTIAELIADLERVQARMQSGAPAPHAPIPVTGGVTPAPHGAPTGPMSGGAWTPQSGYHTGGQYGYPPTGPLGGDPSSGPHSAPVYAAPPPKPAGRGAGMVIGLVAGGIALVALAV